MTWENREFARGNPINYCKLRDNDRNQLVITRDSVEKAAINNHNLRYA